jgi:hypothetical protein
MYPTNKTVWEYILDETLTEHWETLDQSLDQNNIPKYKKRFRKMFLETTRKWLQMINNFFEEDTARSDVWNSKEDNEEQMEEEEALLTAIEFRKIAILENIDWQFVKSWYKKVENSENFEDDDSTDDDDSGGEGQNINDDDDDIGGDDTE